jgi:hypothetical protein
MVSNKAIGGCKASSIAFYYGSFAIVEQFYLLYLFSTLLETFKFPSNWKIQFDYIFSTATTYNL